MRVAGVVLAILCADVAGAETLAMDYHERCTGPALEMQARVMYGTASCQMNQSCLPFDARVYVSRIETECFTTATDICVVSDNADGCVLTILDRLKKSTASLNDSFTVERVEAAAGRVDGFRGKGLLRALEQREALISDLCPEPRAAQELQLAGLSEETVCASFQALIANSSARYIERLTEQAEAN